MNYDVEPEAVPGECGFCSCCSGCVDFCSRKCVAGEEREEKKGRMEDVMKDLETLLRVLQVPDTSAAFAAMEIMEKEAADEEAEYESEEEESSEEEEDREEEEHEEEQEIVGSDISGSDFD